MRPKLLRNAALAVVLLGCASTQTLSAEYALDPQQHPEGIECFYSCLKQTDEEERRFCLSFCEGVEVSVTSEPCAPGSPALCRGYRVPYDELTYAAEMGAAEDYDDEGSEVAGEILGGIFAALIEAAICGGDCDDDDWDDDDDRDDTHQRARTERTRARKDSPPPRTQRAPKPSSDRRGRPRK
jgi:hypothetical protein